METSLHRELKEQYGPAAGANGQLEVWVGAYRADAMTDDGLLVEIQSGPLGPLRAKLATWLPERTVRVVKPVVLTRRILRRARRDGADVSGRLSPKRGALLDVFDDFLGLVRVFPHPNLSVEVVGVEIEEVRVPRRRWPGFEVVDRRLRAVMDRRLLTEPDDLWSLLPDALDRVAPFTTRDLADTLHRPRCFAQRVAYCLRLTGAVEPVGKVGNSRIYRRNVSTAVPCGH